MPEVASVLARPSDGSRSGVIESAFEALRRICHPTCLAQTIQTGAIRAGSRGLPMTQNGKSRSTISKTRTGTFVLQYVLTCVEFGPELELYVR